MRDTVWTLVGVLAGLALLAVLFWVAGLLGEFDRETGGVLGLIALLAILFVLLRRLDTWNGR